MNVAAATTDKRITGFDPAADPQFAALYFQYGRSGSQPT